MPVLADNAYLSVLPTAPVSNVVLMDAEINAVIVLQDTLALLVNVFLLVSLTVLERCVVLMDAEAVVVLAQLDFPV
jgi:hypothetical protein